ncbi:hypothetical protein J6590_015497 [Homalodisca vitripennis]|nr:hypothetical protein J6590_015497 [Homalodisca vitripennis]
MKLCYVEFDPLRVQVIHRTHPCGKEEGTDSCRDEGSGRKIKVGKIDIELNTGSPYDQPRTLKVQIKGKEGTILVNKNLRQQEDFEGRGNYTVAIDESSR